MDGEYEVVKYTCDNFQSFKWCVIYKNPPNSCILDTWTLMCVCDSEAKANAVRVALEEFIKTAVV